MDEAAFQQLLAVERPRLVRLCAHLLGDHDAAEDTAQEVSLAAWRQRAQLRTPQAGSAWLSGIARNMCAQWWRTHGRKPAQLPLEDLETASAQPDDFTVDLERHELAILLDRALALLPADTRAVLVQKYIAESPHATIAAQLGLSENAVAVRVHRGRLALQKVFATTFRAEAQGCGLVSTESADWQTTRIWCPFCGARKLLVRFVTHASSVRFCCPDCRHHIPTPIVDTNQADLLDGVKHHKPLLSRQLAYAHAHYQHALTQRRIVCPTCCKSTHVHLRLPDDPTLPAAFFGERGVYIQCDACAWTSTAPLQHLALDLPQTRQFWRTNPRMRLEREHEVEHDGRAAVVTTFASVTTAARLSVIVDAETLVVRLVEGV